MVFLVLADPDDAFSLARRGGVDLLPGLTPEQAEAYLGDGAMRARFDPVVIEPPSFVFWVYNTLREPFSDPRVRRAMTQLIDRETMRCTMGRCLSRSVSQPWMPGHPAHDPEIRPWPYDPAAARGLLEDAGWTDRDGDGVLDRDGTPFGFTLLISTVSRTARAEAGVVQRDLAAAGIRMDVEERPWDEVIRRLGTHDFDAAPMGWSLRWENDFHGAFTVDGPVNYGGWSHPRAERLIAEARSTLDPEARNVLFRELARILHEEQPLTYFYGVFTVSLVARDVVGARPSFEWFALATVGWRESSPPPVDGSGP